MTERTDEIEAGALSQRQRDVLEVALNLIVAAPKPLTMSAVARAARCSKETLYRWFGDRDGLLTATVRWQASKVRRPEREGASTTRERLHRELARFAQDWLAVLSSRTSIALNRLAVAEAGSGTADLGAIVLRNGPVAMAGRLTPTLREGAEAGLLVFDDADAAFSTFFGLVVRDIQIRLLLGDAIRLDEEAIQAAAMRAADQFFALFGADENRALLSGATRASPSTRN